MQSIHITDKFGFDVGAQPVPKSALAKYFRQLPTLRLDSLDLTKVSGLTLGEPAIESLTAGASFVEPISLGQDAPEFSIGAGAHASIEIIDDAGDLPGSDDSVTLSDDDRYVALGIEAKVTADLEPEAGKLQFGVAPSSALNFVSYSPFVLSSGVTLVDAIVQTVASFSIPFTCDDLADLPPGHISKVEARGTLELSGTVNLLAVANPLASASLPAPLPAVAVGAGGSATVGVSCEIETGYEIVVRKLNNSLVRLSWGHKNSAETSVNATVSEGVSATFGSTDLFAKVIGLISADPLVDLKELQSGGLSEGQASEIESAVTAATARKLEIAVAGELTASASHGAAFLYEINPAALTAESRSAVNKALRGDLTGLHEPDLPGITCVNSIWDKVSKFGLELDINLLGILNFRSVASLSLAGKILYEPATGALVITDKATAERIQSTQVNFGANLTKLRHVLAESFLLTAAYQGSKQLAGAASLHCMHSFFELDVQTSAGEMARKLRTGLALGLVTDSEAKLPEGVPDFGRTLFSASMEYQADLAAAMFLDEQGAALPRGSYERAGRAAIQFLVSDEDLDAVRRRPAIDDQLWGRMQQTGQPGFAALFPGLPAPLVGAIVADYSTIEWWTEAMHGMAQQLAAFRLWQARNPTASFDDPEFQKQRDGLAKYLRQVAATTRDEFGQPWGLIAMSLLTNRKAGAKFQITGPMLAMNKSRALVATA